LHGFLNIDKPAGLTSFDVLRRIKKVLPKKTRIGHLGTLDPMATGVLPVAIGNATRVISLIEKSRKRYQAGMCLGGTSDTEDAWGEITLTGHSDFDLQALQEILAGFSGAIDQVPPMYSALHHQGRRLYELARKGEVVERPPRQVIIYGMTLLSVSQHQGLPLVSLDVVCSPGTYIRSLCRDIGDKLGTGAYLQALRRMEDGCFSIAAASSLDDIISGPGDLSRMLLPVDYPFPDWPNYQLQSEEEETLFWHGRSFAVSGGEAAPLVIIHNRQGLMAGIGRLKASPAGLCLIPCKVFH
jgi:tRNA pseudouridine55 synthase